MKNALYLLEMGCNYNESYSGDVNNHRVRVVDNIDIIFEGKQYNLFFEFTQRTSYRYRTTNKRTGKELKHPVYELINKNGLGIDTQYEKEEKESNYTWFSSWRLSALEKEVYNSNPEYTRKNILDIVNKYAVKPFDKVVLIEEEAKKIASRIGANREKEILKNDCVISIGHTWNNEHKVITIQERVKTPMGNNCYKHELGRSFDVDLVTGGICG